MVLEDDSAEEEMSNEEEEEEEEGVEEEEAGDDDEEEPEKREPYNDQVGLQSKLKEIKLNLDWVETLDVTIETTNLKPHNTTGNETLNKEIDGKDDFRREMLFYCQAQEAAKEALSRLQSLGIPTQRPDDYFAEMVKSDGHMQKVRKKLLEKKDGIEASEKAKRQRELKKIGKKVQHNVLQKRQAEKKKMLQEVDRMKKGKSDKLYGDSGGDPFDVSADKKSGIGQKRKRKDEKFGFGGRKRKLKKNSAESASEMSSFKSHVHGKGRNSIPGKGGRKGRGPPGGKAKPMGKNINHNKAKKRGKR